MVRVCYEKATKRIIEMQSSGDTPEHLQTLIDNAVRDGWSVDAITCKFMDDAQYAAAQAADPVMVSEKAAKEVKDTKVAKELVDIKALISAENPDATKWKIEEVVAHIRVIETILKLR